MKERSFFMQELEARGVSRREFVAFCGVMATAMALPEVADGGRRQAVERTPKPVLVWLEFQDCAGNTEPSSRASRPTAAEMCSTCSRSTITRPSWRGRPPGRSGAAEEDRRQQRRVHRRRRRIDPDRRRRRVLHDRRTRGARHRPRGVREGRGHDRHRHLCGVRRLAGGGAEPHRRARRGRRRARIEEPDQPPACPANVENLTALDRLLPDVQRRWPPLDRVSSAAVRLRQVDPRQLRTPRALRCGPVRRGVGRRGPPHRLLPLQDRLQGARSRSRTAPTSDGTSGTNWPIGCGHPCIGCAEPDFWDKMTPFYQHLPASPASASAPRSTRSALGAADRRRRGVRRRTA